LYTRYYDSYPAVSPLRTENSEENRIETIETSKTEIEDTKVSANLATKGGILQSIQADDIILIALIFLLLTESDDIIMLLIIGYLLIGDKLPI